MSRVPLISWDEGSPRQDVEGMIASLDMARKALLDEGITESAVIVHPSQFGAMMELREKCLSLDPMRGVSCNEPLGHAGDHKSVGGFPWENEHYPRPRFEGASQADLDAIEEILPGYLEDEAAALVCDDCHRTDGSHDPEVEH